MDLLRQAARHSLIPTGAFDLPPETLARLNWPRTLWLAQYHGVLLSLHHALEQGAPGIMPSGIAAQIEHLRQSNQMRLLGRGRELCLLQDLFDQHNIPVISVAGWTLAQRHHRKPVLREVGGSTAYVVEPKNRSRAEAALTAAGYNLRDDPLRLAEYNRSRVVFHPLPGSFSSRTASSWEKVWETAVAFSFGGRTLRTLSPADWLLQLCVRGNGHLWTQLRRAGDVVALIANTPSLDWNHLLKQAEIQGLDRAVLLGVFASHRLLELPMPETFAHRLKQNPDVAKRVNALVAHAARGTATAPSRTTALRTRLTLKKTLAGKLRHIARYVHTGLRRRAVVQIQPETELAYIGRYSPTPAPVVAAMLRLAGTNSDDVVYDLGCGDGRVVLAAAETHGARGVGIDIDPQRVAEARAGAETRGVTNHVSFECGDVLRAHIGDASVVCLYLQGFAYPTLRRKLERELRPGTRVVSHTFIFPGWPPEQTELVRSGPAKVSQIYLWRIG